MSIVCNYPVNCSNSSGWHGLGEVGTVAGHGNHGDLTKFRCIWLDGTRKSMFLRYKISER